MAGNKFWGWDTANKRTALILSIDSSAGAGDAGKLVALNGSGILADNILNATVTSAANKMVKLDGAGKIDVTCMPTGIAAETITAVVEVGVTLVAGNFVAINSTGKAILANASTGIPAIGFVQAGFAAGATATIYLMSQINTNLTTLTIGSRYFLGASGAVTLTPDSTTSGAVIQELGTAYIATALQFNPVLYGYVA